MTDQATEPESLLELSTLAPTRPTVDIDGKPYDLRLLEYDFGLIPHHELQRDIGEFDKLWDKDKLTSKEQRRLDVLLEQIFGAVIDVPSEVAGTLKPLQKRQVIAVFQVAPAILAGRKEQAETDQAETPKTVEPETDTAGDSSTTES